jgi:hypothetical protein
MCTLRFQCACSYAVNNMFVCVYFDEYVFMLCVICLGVCVCVCECWVKMFRRSSPTGKDVVDVVSGCMDAPRTHLHQTQFTFNSDAGNMCTRAPNWQQQWKSTLVKTYFDSVQELWKKLEKKLAIRYDLCINYKRIKTFGCPI